VSQRGDLNKTLNFYTIPSNLLTGTVTFAAHIGNATRSETLPFVPGKKLRIAWVAMPYRPPQPPPPGSNPTDILPSQDIANKAIADLISLYPVAAGDVTYVFQPEFKQSIRLPFACSSNDGCPADTQYLRGLNDFWNRMSREGKWVNGVRPDRLYGWVPEAAPRNICGIADAIWSNPQKRKGRVAAGIDSCGGETLAHELGHILDDKGLRHTPNRPPEEDSRCAGVPEGPAGDYPSTRVYPWVPLENGA